jgi:copper chaperone CopZ
MTCAGCVRRVEKALRAVPGVQEANIDFAPPQRASVKNDLPLEHAAFAEAAWLEDGAVARALCSTTTSR